MFHGEVVDNGATLCVGLCGFLTGFLGWVVKALFNVTRFGLGVFAFGQIDVPDVIIVPLHLIIDSWGTDPMIF